MSKSVSIDQSHSVIQALANNVDWDALDGDVLQEQIIKNPKEAGKQFTAFLKNGGKVIFDSTRVIKIDRSMPFDPKTFIVDGWSIEEQDERAIALTEINLTEVMFDSTLEKGEEKSIKGEDKLRRLKEKTNRIRLDAGIFKTLWENQILIPEKWKEKTNGNTTFIFFDGTILRGSYGNRYVLYLCWDGGKWDWDCYWLEDVWDASGPSAVLASSTLVSETLVS
jgi:hypothetical protein